MKIAISGKGGVGKTTIAATLARALHLSGFKVLAIDADPNTNLALALGMSLKESEKIIPISENANLIEEKTGVRPESDSIMFRLSFRVDDIIDRFAVQTPSSIDLVVMGAVRSSGQGCMCPANALIRAILRHLLTKRDEVVIVDMEAGIEHLGRGTAEHVDVMLIITEPNLKSLETVKRIYRLSRDMGIKTVFSVGNKVVDSLDEKTVVEFCRVNAIPLLGIVPYNEDVRKNDIQGVMLDARSSAFLEIKQLGDRLLELSEMRP